MKVEILHFRGCPSFQPALECVREVLQQEGAEANVREVEITDATAAKQAGFLGSPTIRVNGLDIEREARGASGGGLCCRTYFADGKRTGVPPREWIEAAVREARGLG